MTEINILIGKQVYHFEILIHVVLVIPYH